MQRAVSAVFAALLALVCATARAGLPALSTAARDASQTAHGAGLEDLQKLAPISARSELQLRRVRQNDGHDDDLDEGPNGLLPAPPPTLSAGCWGPVPFACVPTPGSAPLPLSAVESSGRPWAQKAPSGRGNHGCDRTSRGPPTSRG